ncbi:MAG: 8-amino-7-oxononanoate synthase [Flavipsychrobacter sp.]|nr:8-amino-7-oxononanoate synthase [Flavipsychrobacter sp.]
MDRLEQYLSGKLDERTLAGNLRHLKTYNAPVDLFSNDYLGIATNGILTETHSGASLVHFTGSTGSRLLSGNSHEAEALEDTIAAFHQAEAALLFNSGYDANVGLISCITSRSTTILSDELCHASIIDGIRLSQCSRKYKFGHNDLNELETQLKKYKDEGPVIVVTESVFSMDGDAAPLADMVKLCEQHNAKLIVDEAHATGLFGEHGRGLVCALGLQDRVFARVHTFGKALGCHGAAVVGSALLKQYLINFARSFIYTTALPGHSVLMAANAYKYLSAPSFSNQSLHDLVAYFRARANAADSKGWKDSHSAIQALVIGGNDKCRSLATKLQEAGLQVNPILHPTVPLGMERLRICLHIFNMKEQVDLLFETIQEHHATS